MTRSSVVILFLGLFAPAAPSAQVGGVRCVTLVATLQGREMTIWEYLGFHIFSCQLELRMFEHVVAGINTVHDSDFSIGIP